jgi:hypothetical protein
MENHFLAYIPLSNAMLRPQCHAMPFGLRRKETATIFRRSEILDLMGFRRRISGGGGSDVWSFLRKDYVFV